MFVWVLEILFNGIHHLIHIDLKFYEIVLNIFVIKFNNFFNTGKNLLLNSL